VVIDGEGFKILLYGFLLRIFLIRFWCKMSFIAIAGVSKQYTISILI